MLLNIESGRTEEQFHQYVRPVEKPVLSRFCINLTGITQSIVDHQKPFTDIYEQFIAWIEKLKAEKSLQFASPNQKRVSDGANVTFCSWSNMDLGFYFRVECERNNLERPANLKVWVDGRKIFEVS